MNWKSLLFVGVILAFVGLMVWITGDGHWGWALSLILLTPTED